MSRDNVTSVESAGTQEASAIVLDQEPRNDPQPTTAPKSDVEISPQDQEEIRKWQLSFQFQDQKFGGAVWDGLRDAGWTYASDGSYSRQGMRMPSAKDLVEYLDRFRVPDIDNTLQLPPENPLKGLSLEEIDKGRALRNEAVRCAHRRYERDKKADETTKKKKSNAKRPRAARRRQASIPQQRTSATVFEKGADTFLRRNRQRIKRKHDESSSKDAEEDTTAALRFPTVDETVERFRDFPNKTIERIEKEYAQDFDEWLFLLTIQNSILLHGFGSKRTLLEAFSTNVLDPEGDVLVINGYDRQVSIHTLLDLLVQHFLNGTEPNGEAATHTHVRLGITRPSSIGSHGIAKRAARIAQSLATQQRNRKCPLFLVIHSIDGPSLQSRDAQEALAALVAHSEIDNQGVNAVRLVASVDHINGPLLLWDNFISANFSWIWKEVHTYRPYVEEIAVAGMVDDTRKVSSSRTSRAYSEQTNDTLLNVLVTLASRHAEVLQLLATVQLQQQEERPIDHATLLSYCKEKMIVPNDDTLRRYLTELVDHGIVERRKASGRELLRIPHGKDTLEEICDFEIKKS